MQYAKREAERRYGKFVYGIYHSLLSDGEVWEHKRHYTLKGAVYHGPGKYWKKSWAREVRRTHKKEMLLDHDVLSLTKESRIKSLWDWI